ncbi:hypothetical protein Cph01nite_36560 [Cellulomonas phragmiteti]|uniref:Uncharacterized protein n=1 Tax=Cellulomonas phragmiteti TaxID=478780 RepID=A0ABQ4DRC6_9CELL|nr:hypothetical protein Cph01nite_36560 [Cellulomonas phragmiteti]
MRERRQRYRRRVVRASWWSFRGARTVAGEDVLTPLLPCEVRIRMHLAGSFFAEVGAAGFAQRRCCVKRCPDLR